MRGPRVVGVGLLGMFAIALHPTSRAGDPPPSADQRPVDFQREVRPILAENCLLCHGPDSRDRRSELRFDERESPFKDLGGYAAIVPGKSDHSKLIERVTSADHPMPPPETGKSLTSSQVDVLKRWIDQGAVWKEHWAYIAPQRPELPVVSDQNWVRGPIDRFVMRKLDEAGVRPNPEADKATLLRRVTVDLTGLPPTVEELDAFLSDPSEDAYERVVERLLESPRHAERLAKDWLDAARYGDTHGYHLDNERRIWRYRDWVIDAFRSNLPFDRFTIEQLAGDLLPSPTLDQRIATGFLRCNPTTAEGGLIEEEYLVKYAVDRVETVSTVWLGSTFACAQCHDHKYDPIGQNEFYRFFAFFNNIAERGTDENIPNPMPFLKAPTAAQASELTELETRIADLVARQDAPDPAIDDAQARFEAEWSARFQKMWSIVRPVSATAEGGATLSLEVDDSLVPSGPNPDRDAYVIEFDAREDTVRALRIEALRHESCFGQGVGRADNSNFVLTDVIVEARARSGGEFERIELAGATADFSQPGYPIEDAIDRDPSTGWAIQFKPEERVASFALLEPIRQEGGARIRLTLRFDSVFPRHAMGRFRIATTSDPAGTPIAKRAWRESRIYTAPSFDEVFASAFAPETGGDVEWRERADLKDAGRSASFSGDLSAVYLRRELIAPEARTIEFRLGSDDGVKVWLNGEVVHEKKELRSLLPDSDRVMLRLKSGSNDLLVKVANAYGNFSYAGSFIDTTSGGLPPAVATMLARAPAERDDTMRRELMRYFRSAKSDSWKALESERVVLAAKRAELDAAIPTTLVAAEADMRRQAHFLVRGQYDRKGDPVSPGTPAALPPLPSDRPADRLALAEWLVDRKNPLTARVTMNRLWQRFFGGGIVETLEDFGLRGSPPSHPELLDWLAFEFMESGWDTRHMIRQFVHSAAYRQSAVVTAEQLELDPKNRLLGRGARFRLDAEAIRDSALFIAGLLVERVGGPSVKPYQPDGIWQAVAYPTSNTARYKRDAGESLYRRSLYTFWKRTAPPPSLSAFDAPSREHCCVQRPITNTPLQALALMNDVQYVEAARAFAQRMLAHSASSDLERLTFGFRAATSRTPRADELAVLETILAAQRLEYAASRESALALLAHGESSREEGLDVVEHATWTIVANLLLNLDEAITRG